MRPAWEILELPGVLAMLENRCSWALSKEMALQLTPSADYQEVLRRQRETEEAREIWRLYPTLPLGGIRDVREALRKATLVLPLEPSELLALADTLRAARRLNRFCAGLPEEAFPLFREQGGRLGSYRPLEEAIRQAIKDDATVADEASPGLARVRRLLRSAQEKLKSRLDGLLRSAEYQKMLQEVLVTVRGGRYVVPVRQEYRSQFPGLVHDLSASGATVFMEPLAVMEQNNEIKKLEAEERREVEEILRGLTIMVAASAAEIEATLAALGELDLALAKGRLSQDLDCVEPQLSKKGELRLLQACHPYLGREAVPIDVELGVNYDLLVITGPNTGGKTVSLKTVGLLVLMAQCGLHLPAAPGSMVPVYRRVFADIGDEQSIEQSLSTFSSHLVNIVAILKEAGNGDLALLDELGAGTDPAEGASLASAILEELRLRHVHTVATTHYDRLKHYAYTTPRVENASVEFDEESLQPTYRLLTGLPGRSNALAIASRLGLEEGVVRRARGYLPAGEQEVGTLLQRLEEDRRGAEEARRQAEELAAEAKRRVYELERAQVELREKERETLERARREAADLLAGIRRESEELLATFGEALDREEETARQRAATALREDLRGLQKQFGDLVERERQPACLAGLPSQGLKVGDLVEVPRLKQAGTVLTSPNTQGEVQVQLGALRVTLPLSELLHLEGTKKSREKPAEAAGHALFLEAGRAAPPQVDLRGLTVEEALERVDKYLDGACLAGLSQVVLIHGKGTGALRAAIQSHLKNHPQVREQRPGGQGEGGSGVTIATLA